MKTLSRSLSEIKAEVQKSSYLRKTWTTNEENKDDNHTLEEYAALIDPVYKYVNGNPTIFTKEVTKDGRKYTFLKMLIPIKGTGGAEYDLSYENDFEDGDEIDVETLSFHRETFLDSSHWYATGTVI